MRPNVGMRLGREPGRPGVDSSSSSCLRYMFVFASCFVFAVTLSLSSSSSPLGTVAGAHLQQVHRYATPLKRAYFHHAYQTGIVVVDVTVQGGCYRPCVHRQTPQVVGTEAADPGLRVATTQSRPPAETRTSVWTPYSRVPAPARPEYNNRPVPSNEETRAHPQKGPANPPMSPQVFATVHSGNRPWQESIPQPDKGVGEFTPVVLFGQDSTEQKQTQPTKDVVVNSGFAAGDVRASQNRRNPALAVKKQPATTTTTTVRATPGFDPTVTQPELFLKNTVGGHANSNAAATAVVFSKGAPTERPWWRPTSAPSTTTTTTRTSPPVPLTVGPAAAAIDPLPSVVGDQFRCGFRDVDLVCGLTDSVCINEFPWVAVLVQKPSRVHFRPKSADFCAGVLVHGKFVLAARPCVENLESIRFNEHTLDNAPDCSPGIVKVCSDFKERRRWRRVHHHATVPVSLVELDDSVTDEEAFTVYPACVPTDELADAGLYRRASAGSGSRNGNATEQVRGGGGGKGAWAGGRPETAYIPLVMAGWGTAAAAAAGGSAEMRQSKVELVQCRGPESSGVVCAREVADKQASGCVADRGSPLLAATARLDPQFGVPLFLVVGIETASASRAEQPEPCSSGSGRPYYYVPSFRDWIVDVVTNATSSPKS